MLYLSFYVCDFVVVLCMFVCLYVCVHAFKFVSCEGVGVLLITLHVVFSNVVIELSVLCVRTMGPVYC